MVFASYDQKTAIEELKEHQVYVELSEIEKVSIMRPLRYFSDVESGTIFISDRAIKDFIKKNMNELWKVISITYEQRSEEATNKLFGEVDIVTKYGKQYSKEEYLALLRESGEMHQEIEYAIFDPLCAYLNKVIMDFANAYLSNDEVFEAGNIADHEFNMLAIIQEAARLYKINTRADLYQNLLSNKRLMYFVESRSHSLLRILVKGYIDLNIELQNRHYHKVDMNNISFLMNYVFINITDSEEENANLIFYRKRVIGDIALILRENDLLDDKIYEMVEGDYSIEEIFGTFVTTNCQDEVQDLAFDIDYELSVDQDSDRLIEYFYKCIEGYDQYNNVYDKILCAYHVFNIAFYLAEQEQMSDQEYNALSHVCQTIEDKLRYCFYPEIFAMFDMFFGRLYPNNILWRISVGIGVLKHLGFKTIYESYQEAYDYFKKQ